MVCGCGSVWVCLGIFLIELHFSNLRTLEGERGI